MRYTITSRFGEMESGLRSRPHTGIDFAMPKNTNVHSVSDGTISIHDYGSFNAGKTVIVEDENGREFIYGHLSKFNVRNGEHVDKGKVIGMSGSSGHSTGFHLHFGMKDTNGHYTDPSQYIPKIEHMNDKVQIAADHSTNFMNVIHQQMNIYSDLLHNIKINFINLFHSVDYSVLIQHFQNFIDLFF